MFVFHPLSEPTRRSLIDGGLDPDAVAGIVRNAVTEDLMGGVDVTSTATIPVDHRSTATFGARQRRRDRRAPGGGSGHRDGLR
jgi:nicotinate-nucleotide pyrophosphorylase (carboxylating)